MTEEEVTNIEKMKQEEKKQEEELQKNTQVVDVNYEGHEIPENPPELVTLPKKNEPKVKAAKPLAPKPAKDQLPPPPIDMALDIPNIDKPCHLFTEERLHEEES